MVFPGTITKTKKMNVLVLLVYVIMGIYFVNYPFQYIQIPENISNFDPWIILIGGLLMLFGAINYFKVKRN